jgi:hypothetical protein
LSIKNHFVTSAATVTPTPLVGSDIAVPVLYQKARTLLTVNMVKSLAANVDVDGKSQESLHNTPELKPLVMVCALPAETVTRTTDGAEYDPNSCTPDWAVPATRFAGSIWLLPEMVGTDAPFGNNCLNWTLDTGSVPEFVSE